MLFFFFFSSRRRHTRWTGDWSSDVCSSDLGHVEGRPRLPADALARGDSCNESRHELRGVDGAEAAREVIAGEGRETGHVVPAPVRVPERADVIVAARDVDDPVIAGER